MKLLEKIEGRVDLIADLEIYGNKLDRIMGGARTLALEAGDAPLMVVVSDYAALCKIVSYKASQIKGNDTFYDVCVALLLDATERLLMLLDQVDVSAEEAKALVSDELLGRLAWVSAQFANDVRSTVASPSTESDEMKRLLARFSKKS